MGRCALSLLFYTAILRGKGKKTHVAGNRSVALCARLLHVGQAWPYVFTRGPEDEALTCAGRRLSGKSYVDNSRDTINRWLWTFLIHEIVLCAGRKLGCFCAQFGAGLNHTAEATSLSSVPADKCALFRDNCSNCLL